MNNQYSLRKKTGMSVYYRTTVFVLLSFLILLVSGCATSGLEKPTKLIIDYRKERVICLPPPKMKPLSLNDIKYVLGKNDTSGNLIAVDGFDWEKVSDNDKSKYEVVILFGLISLHYLDCINNHNENVK